MFRTHFITGNTVEKKLLSTLLENAYKNLNSCQKRFTITLNLLTT